MRYTVGIGAIGLVVYSLFAPEALLVFTTREYLPARTVVPLIFAGRFLFTLQVFAVGMWVSNRTYLVGLISVLGILLDVWLNLELVPVHGMMGTAVAGCIAGGSALTLSMNCSQRLYPVPHRWTALLFPSLICIALAWAGRSVDLPLFPGLAVKSSLVLFAAATIVAFGVIRKDELGVLGRFAAGKLTSNNRGRPRR